MVVQALNQLFEKIIALDIEERHLLRMGHGEEALETNKDFSRYGHDSTDDNDEDDYYVMITLMRMRQ